MHRQRFMRSGLSWLHCVFLTFVLVTSFGSVTYLTWSQQIETEATLVDRRLPASLLEEVNASSQSRGQDYKVQDIHLGCLRIRLSVRLKVELSWCALWRSPVKVKKFRI